MPWIVIQFATTLQSPFLSHFKIITKQRFHPPLINFKGYFHQNAQKKNLHVNVALINSYVASLECLPCGIEYTNV